jgi:hypothetical protein
MYGGMGMGMPGMEQNPTLMNSMIALQSLGYLINSLCDIARSLDQNYEGLQLFRQSFKSIQTITQVYRLRWRTVWWAGWWGQAPRRNQLLFPSSTSSKSMCSAWADATSRPKNGRFGSSWPLLPFCSSYLSTPFCGNCSKENDYFALCHYHTHLSFRGQFELSHPKMAVRQLIYFLLLEAGLEVKSFKLFLVGLHKGLTAGLNIDIFHHLYLFLLLGFTRLLFLLLFLEHRLVNYIEIEIHRASSDS